MDSTLAPTLTNDFRCHYEKYGLMNALCNLVCRRYVDDIFVMLKSKEHLNILSNI